MASLDLLFAFATTSASSRVSFFSFSSNAAGESVRTLLCDSSRGRTGGLFAARTISLLQIDDRRRLGFRHEEAGRLRCCWPRIRPDSASYSVGEDAWSRIGRLSAKLLVPAKAGEEVSLELIAGKTTRPARNIRAARHLP